MVWEVATPTHPSSVQEPEHADVMTDADGRRSHDPLRCDQHFPPSPASPTSDTYMEYDDLPDLQEAPEAPEEAGAPLVYQVDVGVSHQELRPRSPPPPPDTHWLTQLAHIATSPQSPLLQGAPRRSSSSFCVQSGSRDLHSYARPPPPPPPPPPAPPPRRRSRRSGERGAAWPGPPLAGGGDAGWSFSGPPTAWLCFLKGTRLRFQGSPDAGWRDAEDLEEDSGEEEQPGRLKGYGAEGLELLEHADVASSGRAALQLTFDPGAAGGGRLTARCRLDHPFYVRNKGWSSFYPSLTVVHYGIPCYEMQVGDVCLPPGHRDAKQTDDSLVFDTFRSYDFTPLDSSAVYVLSSMARQRRASQSGGGAASPDPGPAPPADDAHGRSLSRASAKSPQAAAAAAPAGDGAAPARCKRPMNAFMLFAKKFRVEYTQMYPGKDNRAISVLLGERWKKMRNEERRTFTLEAKALAEEQKRLNPDCWKRKRSNSGSQGN